MLKQVSDILGPGFERILFLLLTSIMVCHVFACLWVFTSQMIKNDDQETWMDGEISE